jgi:hypothetical protein
MTRNFFHICQVSSVICDAKPQKDLAINNDNLWWTIFFFKNLATIWQPSYCLGLDMTSFFFFFPKKWKRKIQDHEFFIFHFFGKIIIFTYPGEKNSQKRKRKKFGYENCLRYQKNILIFFFQLVISYPFSQM